MKIDATSSIPTICILYNMSGLSFLHNNTTKQYFCRGESVLMELKFLSDRWDNSDSSSGTFPFSPAPPPRVNTWLMIISFQSAVGSLPTIHNFSE